MKRKKTPEERAAERAYQEDLTRRLRGAIEHFRARADEKRRLSAEETAEGAPIDSGPVRKSWFEMTREERAADRARSRDLDRRLRAAIERYRAINAEKRRRREAEAS
jgi:hypothetical protein